MDILSSWTNISLCADYKDPLVYDPYVNVPFGISRYKDKLFVTVPRRNPGIPATLNVIDLKGNPPYINPLLIGFPSYQMNSLSVRLRMETCDDDELFFSWLDSFIKNQLSENIFFHENFWK